MIHIPLIKSVVEGSSLKDNLVAAYEFEETTGTVCYDSHATNNGTINGATINQTGIIEKCYDFDGSSSYVQIDGSNFEFERTDEFSISFWANQDVSSWGSIISTEGNTVNYPGLLVVFTTRTLWIQLGANVSNTRIIVTIPLGSLNTWVHYAFSYDGSSTGAGIKVYKDGIAQITTVVADNLTSSMVTGADLFIGKRASSIHYFNGGIDQLFVWKDRALTEDENTWLYGSGNGRSYSEL